MEKDLADRVRFWARGLAHSEALCESGGAYCFGRH
jgi:hypothetical protein